MKFYNYWVRETGKLVVDGRESDAKFWGKSNISIDDARRDALAQAKRVQQKIDGQESVRTEYQVPIREEILQTIDKHNLITRNWYGDRVLNSENTMFVDIDQPKLGFFASLFGAGHKSKFERILYMIEKRSQKSKFRDLCFRVYQTKAGARLLVQGRRFHPSSRESDHILHAFHADALYALLCRRQECYRARLTPKPHRMKVKGHRVAYPRTEEQEAALLEWLETYEARCREFSTCRFIKDIGPFRQDAITRYHDQATGALDNRPLA